MLKWRIYYADRSTFDSTRGSPGDAPPFGVLFVVAPDESVGRVVHNQWDYYLYMNGVWSGHNFMGLIDQFAHRAGEIEACLVGRFASNEVYAQVLQRATNDPDFPVRSASRAIEQPQVENTP